jgi:hypothetical protein
VVVVVGVAFVDYGCMVKLWKLNTTALLVDAPLFMLARLSVFREHVENQDLARPRYHLHGRPRVESPGCCVAQPTSKVSWDVTAASPAVPGTYRVWSSCMHRVCGILDSFIASCRI